MLELVGVRSNLRSLGSVQVSLHLLVVWEQRGGSTDLGTHVTDSSHTGTRQGIDTGSVVFDDSASSALDSQDTSDLKDDIFLSVYEVK